MQLVSFIIWMLRPVFRIAGVLIVVSGITALIVLALGWKDVFLDDEDDLPAWTHLG